MEKLSLILILSTVLIFSCSKSGIHDYKRVSDSPRDEQYYENSSCDHGHEVLSCTHPKENAQNIRDIFKLSKKNQVNMSREIASASDLYKMVGSSSCSDLTKKELEDLELSADILGGHLIDPMDYPNSIQGLQSYIEDSGVIDKFSAAEMVAPNHLHVAQSCGFGSTLVPPRCRWQSGAVQGLLAGKLRGAINNGDPYGEKKITLRNWYRPRCYNENVGGAGQSDHIQARGFDLDFPSAIDRAKAQKYLCDLYKERPFNLQVGIGCRTLHIGMGSPKRMSHFGSSGARFWTYGSLQNCPLKRVEGDNCWLINGGHKRIHTSRSGFSGAL